MNDKPVWRRSAQILATLLLVLIVAVAPAQDTSNADPTEAKPQPDAVKLVARLVVLQEKVIADPMDTVARGELVQLRKKLDAARSESLGLLIEGLEFYLANDGARTNEQLKKACDTPFTRALAEKMLLKSPAEMLAEHPPEKAKAPAPKACGHCGGTEKADCRVCWGSGQQECSQCKGTGKGKTTYGSTLSCRACNGTGVVACQECKGTGFLDCPKCVENANAVAGTIGRHEAQAIRKLILMARYLANGGLDLYSDKALIPSPASKPDGNAEGAP